MNVVETLSARLKAMTTAERQRVAEASGVPFPTVQKIAIGQTRNPRFNTVNALQVAINSAPSTVNPQ